ncbi:urea transporter [Myroides odoratus]|uniref:Urea transporter n=1 Tax=Myroides odoratus TaxID=256 RepID=A0A378RK22_MYROD|nr:urea transporter [Myroides odoratus]QQU05107.1 urea transporter [Myroides odoratus]STZ27413.1 Urea transporter [Myroides odoratus]
MKALLIHCFNAFFKGFGQIMLQANTLTGILFLAAIYYDSTDMALAASLSNVVAILTAKLLKYDEQEIEDGLYGFNPCLIAIALMFYFQPSLWVYLLMIASSIASTILMHWAMKRELPAYTFPFIIFTWISLFILSIPDLAIRSVPEHFVDIQELDDFLIQGHAFGQVLFQGSFVAGVVFFLGVFISRPIQALYGFVAVIVSVYISHSNHASNALINEGVFSFNAVLCGIAMGEDKVRAGMYVLISVIISTYFDIFMIQYGWTTLTFPFVFAMWVMYPIKRLDKWIVLKLEELGVNRIWNELFHSKE